MNLIPVAVCIPTANLGEYSLVYLEECLLSIFMQGYKNIKVYISDHSQDNEIQDYLMHQGFNIIYERYNQDYGNGAANMNNALDMAPKNTFIKMLFQDDMLHGYNAIHTMVRGMLDRNAYWVGVGCNHVDEIGKDLNHLHPPRWIDDLSMAHGLNLIGSPSVVMFKNCDLRMDTNLHYLNDCEFYYRMGQQYGPPVLINELLVTIRVRAEGLSSKIDIETVRAKESSYLQKKFGEVE